MKIVIIEGDESEHEIFEEELDEVLQSILADIRQTVKEQQHLNLDDATFRIHLRENQCLRIEIIQGALTTEELIENNEVRFAQLDFNVIRKNILEKHQEMLAEMEVQFKKTMDKIDYLEQKQVELSKRLDGEIDEVYNEAKELLGL